MADLGLPRNFNIFEKHLRLEIELLRAVGVIRIS